MTLDITSLGIFLGIVGSIIFGALDFRRRHQFDISNIALVFLAIFAILAGIELILAAIKGDPNNLPSAWREYLAVAGMVGIGLSLNFVVQALKKVLSEPVKARVVTQSDDAKKR